MFQHIGVKLFHILTFNRTNPSAQRAAKRTKTQERSHDREWNVFSDLLLPLLWHRASRERRARWKRVSKYVYRPANFEQERGSTRRCARVMVLEYQYINAWCHLSSRAPRSLSDVTQHEVGDLRVIFYYCTLCISKRCIDRAREYRTMLLGNTVFRLQLFSAH